MKPHRINECSNPSLPETHEAWKPPFCPWFEGDFCGSLNVRKMAPLARLMYRSLLLQAWHSDRPPCLAADDRTLQLMADAPTSELWAQHKEEILRRFQKTQDGEWFVHPKMLREYKRALSEHERKAKAGIRGNMKRWNRSSFRSTPPNPAEILRQQVKEQTR